MHGGSPGPRRLSILQQHALAEDVGGEVISGVLEAVHEGGADAGGDEFAEGATVGVDARLLEGEDLLQDCPSCLPRSSSPFSVHNTRAIPANNLAGIESHNDINLSKEFVGGIHLVSG